MPAIISTIQDRGYVKLVSRRFYAEKLGDIVTERLKRVFPRFDGLFVHGSNGR